jgi:hypothetical protein
VEFEESDGMISVKKNVTVPVPVESEPASEPDQPDAQQPNGQ